MCVDCVLASPRITQVDPGDKPLPEVVLSQEGPYEVVQMTRLGLYRLQREDGSEVPNSWNDD
jgi:hypothetical protein